MAKGKNGWIKVPRDFTDSPVWTTNEPFGIRDAYIDLMFMANYEAKQFLPKHSKKVLTIHEGEILTSFDHLAERWGWTKRKVVGYIERLESTGMIQRKSYNFGTVLSLAPSGFLGFDGTANDTANGTTNDTTKGTPGDTANDTRKDTRLKNTRSNKNVKENKEIKNALPGSGVFSWEGEPE